MPRVEPGLVKCSSITTLVGAVTSAISPEVDAAGFHLGEAEIENLGVPALGDENVGGFNVAMDNPFGMRRVQRVGNLDAERQDRFQLHGTRPDHVLERDPIQEFHDEKGASIFLADVVNRADVGMIERGGGLGFASESFERLAVLGEFLGQKLQGDKTAEARVFGFIDHAHATAAELLDDPVMGDVVKQEGGLHKDRAMLRRKRAEVKKSTFVSVIAFHEKAGRSQVDSLLAWLNKVCFSRRVAAVAMLPSALSRSDSFRSVHVGRSRFSRCCHLFGALWFCSFRVEPGPGH